jgi:histidine ammonia-lyase
MKSSQPTYIPLSLSRKEAIKLAQFHPQQALAISPSHLKKVKTSFDYVKRIIEAEKPVYGINTGFGALAHQYISKGQLSQLQTNLIRSHCTGMGEPFPTDIVRLIILIRVHCLQQGHSGVSPELLQSLLNLLNHQIHPIIPRKGSVGASGDLAPLAHLAAVIMGEGRVEFQGGTTQTTQEVFQKCHLKAHALGPKEGLALINGTTVMCALAVWCLEQMEQLIKVADVAGVMTLEGLRGTDKAFHALIQLLKPHPGQIAVGENLRKLLEGSQIIHSHQTCHRVQDPYSLRCMPQVHGAIRQTFLHSCEVVDRELNAVTDNPLIFPEEDLVVSGGNFHGEALALCMDYMAMGLSELANICERRIEKMMNPVFSELPAFLMQESGLNSGPMIAHVTVAALVSENKILCHPASVDSIPTSTDKEDHVSMGVTAGLKLLTIIENVRHCLAIEFLCNTQAMDFLRPLKSSPAIESVYDLIRESVPPIKEDRYFYEDIEKIVQLIQSGKILKTVEQQLGAPLL